MSLTADRAEAGAVGSSNEPAVVVRGVSKSFDLPQRQVHTLKERILHPFSSNPSERLNAVRNVSFEVAQGEFFGIVGRNGSGKSTLLKCMAGIYDVDGGEMSMRGRVSPFIELGVGFNPELTARDNVIINAVMLGLTRKEARARFDKVIAFAELEKFLDLKLKNYSSGMNVRLAFSTAIQVDADVLLIDEVLAVGDIAFQQKCFDEFHRLKAQGKTIVFVTHDMASVQRFCDRAMLLELGAMLDLGEPTMIARRYNEVNFGKLIDEAPDAQVERGVEAAVVASWFEDPHGAQIAAAGQRDTVALCCEIEARTQLENPMVSFVLRNEVRHIVFASSTRWDVVETGSFAPGDRAVARLELPLWLVPGRYQLSTSVAREGAGADVLHLAEDAASIVVHGTRHSGGVVDIPHEVRLERR